MIYLLEDRRDRLEQQLKVKLNEKLIKTDATMSCTKEEVDEYIVEHFPDAKLILLHRSYEFVDNEITPEYLQSVFNAHGVSVVVFSGDNSSNVSKNNGTIKSDDLYANLPWFVTQNDETNISKLIFGERYLINILLAFQVNVYDKLFSISDSDELAKKEIGELKFLLPNLKAPELAQIKDDLKGLLSRDEPVTAGFFKDYIQQVIDKQ